MGLRGLEPIDKLILIMMGDVTPMDGWWEGEPNSFAERLEISLDELDRRLAGLESRGVVRRDGWRVYLSGADVLDRASRRR